MGVRSISLHYGRAGNLKLETDNAVVPNGHRQGGNGTSAGTFPSQAAWYNQYELTYGLTNRIEAAAYLDLGLPRGGGYQFAGSEYRLRGRLFDEGVLPVDLGWYVELEWHRTPQFDDVPLELEFKSDSQKAWAASRSSPIQNLKNRSRRARQEPGFRVRLRGRALLSLDSAISSPGVEVYGATGNLDDTPPLHEQQHYIFPSSGASCRIASTTTSVPVSASPAAPTA